MLNLLCSEIKRNSLHPRRSSLALVVAWLGYNNNNNNKGRYVYRGEICFYIIPPPAQIVTTKAGSPSDGGWSGPCRPFIIPAKTDILRRDVSSLNAAANCFRVAIHHRHTSQRTAKNYVTGSLGRYHFYYHRGEVDAAPSPPGPGTSIRPQLPFHTLHHVPS